MLIYCKFVNELLRNLHQNTKVILTCTSKIRVHCSEGNLTGISAINHCNWLENYPSKIPLKSPRPQWVNLNLFRHTVVSPRHCQLEVSWPARENLSRIRDIAKFNVLKREDFYGSHSYICLVKDGNFSIELPIYILCWDIPKGCFMCDKPMQPFSWRQ